MAGGGADSLRQHLWCVACHGAPLLLLLLPPEHAAQAWRLAELRGTCGKAQCVHALLPCPAGSAFDTVLSVFEATHQATTQADLSLIM